MKRLIYTLAVGFIGLTACNDDIEIWDSAVLDYSGSYIVQVQEEDGTVVSDYQDDHKIDIYNTSNDLPNELWITDYGKDLELTSKFFLTGDVSNFASKSLEFDDLPLNLSTVKADERKPAPTGADQVVTDTISGAKVALIEGKIVKDAMTTIGGNVADSIYLKLQFIYGAVTFKSKEVPVDKRTDPEVAEFKWVVESSVRNTADIKGKVREDEFYVYSGYRYTGFPEDAN